MVKTEPGSANIFNITQPELYRCQIVHYQPRLSLLACQVFQGPATIPVLYLQFSDVGYVDAPVSWQGADFHIAERDTCIEMMMEVGLIGPAILQFAGAYAAITDHARLYTMPGERHTVRIIASHATLSREAPTYRLPVS